MRGRFRDQIGWFSYILPEHRGILRVGANFILNLIASNLIRIPRLIAA
jgi:hypothetical protein